MPAISSPLQADALCRPAAVGELVPQQASVLVAGVTSLNMGPAHTAKPTRTRPQQSRREAQRRSESLSGSGKGDTPGTTAGLGDVPPHTPQRCPCSLEVQLMNSASSALVLGRLLGRETRGERRPFPGKTSTQPWPTSVPCGTSLPPRSSLRTESRRTPSIGAADCYHARSDPGACGRAQQHQGFARSARRALAEWARP